ncbi:hypothetical protein HDU76_002356 [Blyttiomyces sp. JEL0837]|nr:hypothetical protein HDU76_002356 [Blyttiomyces sp. JEL0837]
MQKKEGDAKNKKSAQTKTDLFPPSQNKPIDDINYLPYNFIFMLATPVFVDPVSKTARLFVTFLPEGDFIGNVLGSNLGLFTLKYPVSILFQNKNVTFPAGVLMQPQEISFALVTGDVNSYPFEQYTTDLLEITATYTTPDGLLTAPIGFAIEGGLQTWNVEVPTVSDINNDGSVLQLQLKYSRSGTTQFFSVLVMVIMWTLSLLSITLSTTLWMRERKVEPPTLAVSISLLFALPAVRNSQPGIPAIGCTADVVSFFWAMVLAACSASLLYINYITKYKK